MTFVFNFDIIMSYTKGGVIMAQFENILTAIKDVFNMFVEFFKDLFGMFKADDETADQ